MPTRILNVPKWHSDALSVLSFFYWLTLVASIVSYGAVGPTVIACASIVFWLITTTALMLGRPSPTARQILAVAAAVLLAILLWVIIQAVPLPNGSLSYSAWRELGAMPEISKTISLTPTDDRAGFLKIALPWTLFMASLLIFDTDERALRALKVVAVGGGVAALLSILQFVLSPGTLLLWPKRFYLDSLTGSFVNRNTAATFFGLIGLVQIPLLARSAHNLPFLRIFRDIERMRGLPPESSRQLYIFLGYCAALVLTMLCLVLTKSRGGIGSSLIAILFMTLMLAWQPSRIAVRPPNRRSLRALVTGSIFATAIILIFAVTSGGMLRRIAVRGLDDPRFCLTPSLFDAIKSTFPRGSGLSSFSYVFPEYRVPGCGGILFVVNAAHNVYLEALLTLGSAFPVLLLICLGYLVACFIRGIKRRRRYRFAGQIGVSVLLLVSIHSVVDFSVQVPGFAMVFAAVLAPLITLCARNPSKESDPVMAGSARDIGRAEGSTYLNMLTGMPLMFLGALCCWIAAADIRAFYDYRNLLNNAVKLEQTGSLPDSSFKSLLPLLGRVASQNVCRSIVVEAGFTVAMANLDRQDVDRDYEAWTAAMDGADAYVRHALQCLPASGKFWTALAMIRQQVAERPAELAILLDRAYRYAPAEELVLEARFRLWNRLSVASIKEAQNAFNWDLAVYCSPEGRVIKKRVPITGKALLTQIRAVAPECIDDQR